ncbi:hypothetical protein IMSAGC011_02169 [Lachnospiraceae bacterium]|nr:hypothetical protein IMSAGC011_02169 [Lachnospiraceae bacterium]
MNKIVREAHPIHVDIVHNTERVGTINARGWMEPVYADRTGTRLSGLQGAS